MIYYFTGTGNSLFLAEELSKRLDMPIMSMIDAMNTPDFDFGDEKVVGIVCPVYFFTMPTIVEDFISKMKFRTPPEKIFFVYNSGSTPGSIAKQVKKRLSKVGLKLTHSFSVYMPSNYIVLYDVPTADKADAIISDAENLVPSIVWAITEKEKHHDKVKFYSGLISFFVRPIYKKGMSTKEFSVTDKCTSCELCSDICPQKTIMMNEEKPVWTSLKCVRCLACIHRCPQKAIEFGDKTEKRGRYVNPHVRFRN